MTRIADLLARDFSRPIEEIIKVNHDDPDTAFAELTEYIATDRIKSEYERLFSAMAAALKSPHEGVGVWISGPPGSGRSAFARNLGYVLANRDVHGTPASELFLKKMESTRVAESVEFLRRAMPYEIFLVNLPADPPPQANAEYIAEQMYRVLLRELDYGEGYDISELEIDLEKEGKLASFQEVCRAAYKEEWREIRKGGQRFTRTSSLLHRFDPRTYASTDTWLNMVQARPFRRLSARDLVEKSFDLCELRRPGKAFAFIVDEIGPYVALGAERIESLHAVVEQFGRESVHRLNGGKIPGPTWIVVTAHEKLQEASKHLAASRKALPKLRDHFMHQVHLSPDDVRKVVALGVLRKKESQETILRKLFRDCGASLIQNVKLERCSRRSEFDEDQFVRFYPYLPHLIDLSMDILANIRLHPNAPKHAVGNLSIIKQAFEILASTRPRLADEPVGLVVSIDNIYELVEANIPSEKRKRILDIRRRFDNHEDHPGMAGRVAKAICLMEFVKTDLARSTKNIAALLIQNVAEEPPTVAVSKILHALKEAQFVRETEGGWKLYDFDELRRRAADLKDLRNAVGAVNPRPPGWHNDLIQAAKKALARLLTWYTRPLYEFDASVSRSLEEVVWAVDYLTMNLVALDRLSIKQAFDYLPVNMVGLEEQLAQLDRPSAAVAESVKAHVALLHQQVKVLATLQNTVNAEVPAGGMETDRGIGSRMDSRDSDDGLQDKGRRDMQWGVNDCKYRTTYVIGLFGTGRRYISELLLDNIGERAKYFRDGIRLHPGPTPMIYSGHVTTKYPSRAQEAPAVMRYILESVKSGFADLIFVYRHPLDSLLTNWVWWRTYIRDNRVISGIAEAYKNTEDLCADLKENFLEFKSFAEGEPDFFAGVPGPRFLSFSEFVEETELHIQSATLTLRLEDFMIDPLKEFSKILEVMSVDVDSTHLALAPPRAKPYGYLAVKEQVPQFREFINGLDAETKKRIEKIGYNVGV
jgi:hypothetical protein